MITPLASANPIRRRSRAVGCSRSGLGTPLVCARDGESNDQADQKKKNNLREGSGGGLRYIKLRCRDRPKLISLVAFACSTTLPGAKEKGADRITLLPAWTPATTAPDLER